MAERPVPVAELIARFGPHLNYEPPGGYGEQRANPPDRLVKTHCCFCGQQCGIQLKVCGNEVVGFEPWEEFPFNQGMLCPKGVRRYLQSAHPDRFLYPLLRTPQGFRQATWDESLDLTARRLREIQERHGKDAVAVYGGASLITEKSYLLGKFARVALGTRHIDYNGRLCMVSAGTAYKMAFGVDRSPTCAQVCPADAIKKGEDGVVQSALKPRCIACSNCVLACPFGIPKMMTKLELMMKCDMCYDRTSVGKRPMCATVCPSQALAYVTPERIAAERREKPSNVFHFGRQTVTTKVYMMVPPDVPAVEVDVIDYLWEPEP